ncbi:GTP cyclohydrolase 1 type 2 [Candidatus Methanoperedenaceae archaeon GB50]|nr:GTP cyclohydrolase 1 type 2 [Candidatus Methanoperedenaceae archaeon GB50]
MRLSEFVSLLEEIAPPEEALDLDEGRIGLVLDRGGDVERVAVSLDPTDHVLSEAGRIGADLLITHHTLFFDPLTRISQTLSSSLKIALLSDLSLYVMHTNLDRAPGGINDVLAEILGLRDVEACEIGRIGKIETPCELEDFATLVSESLETHVRWVGDGIVERVMVVGGSGFGSEVHRYGVRNERGRSRIRRASPQRDPLCPGSWLIAHRCHALCDRESWNEAPL